MASKKDWIDQLNEDDFKYFIKNQDKIFKTPDYLNNRLIRSNGFGSFQLFDCLIIRLYPCIG